MTRPSGDVGTELVVDEATEVVLNGRLVGEVLDVEGVLVQEAASSALKTSPATAKSPSFLPETTTVCPSLKTGHTSQLLDEGILLSFRAALLSGPFVAYLTGVLYSGNRHV